MDRADIMLIIIVGAAFVWAGRAWWKRWHPDPERPGVVLVRVIPPASNVRLNIMVLAILGGLAWFFWWATHTKFWP